MLYELVAIARVMDPIARSKEVREVTTMVGKMIINNRGVVRDIISLGDKRLPKIIKKDQVQHFEGYHFLMLFDSSIGVQSEILRTLKKDPRVIRSSIIKVDNDKQLDTASSMDRFLGYKSILDKTTNTEFV